MTEDQHIARAGAALGDPAVTREAAAPRAVDPLHEALEDALRKAGQAVLRKWRHMAPVQLADYHGERCDCMPCQMGKLEAALAAMDTPKGGGEACEQIAEAARIAPPATPQPAPVAREALVEAIEGSLYSYSDDRGWEPTGTARSIADALLAAGLRLPEAVQSDETLAWAVIGESGRIDVESIAIDPDEVRLAPQPMQRVVRVAIRRVEDET